MAINLTPINSRFFSKWGNYLVVMVKDKGIREENKTIIVRVVGCRFSEH